MSEKFLDVEVEPTDSNREASDSHLAEKQGTESDVLAMERMGKKAEFRRAFSLTTLLGYSMVLGGTWETSLIVSIFSITNGGTAGAIWVFLAVCVGMCLAVLSLAEMASMAPTSGGQYHWVSEFAPPKYQKFLSYIVGWFTIIAWQAAMAGSTIAIAEQIEAIMVINMPNYVVQGYQSTLFSFAVLIVTFVLNTFLIRQLAWLQSFMVTLHVAGFFVFLIVFWVMSPRADANAVFTSFEDNAGWGNIGLACIVGIIGPVSTVTGSDSAAHMAEEVQNASWALPRSMVISALTNYVTAWVMTITLMFSLGPDVSSVLDSASGQPYIQILLNATGSVVGTSVMSGIVFIIFLFGTVNLLATSSRQVFAFARDNGLPFSKTLSYVRPGWDVPLNAVYLTCAISALLSLIMIGSSIGFSIVVSISNVGITASYFVPIACMAFKRIRGDKLLPSKFDLGRAGLFINLSAAIFLAFVFVMSFFPTGPNPTAVTMNYNILLAGATIIGALGFYYFKARHNYVGPVKYIKEL